MGQFVGTFANVVVPVFALVFVGYFAGPRLGLDARTLSRFAYFVLVPAFVFNVLGTARLEAGSTVAMVGYFAVFEVACAVIGGVIAVLLRRPPAMIAVYILIAVFPNVGNFGLPIVQFALGESALPAATVYFVTSTVVSFVIGVAAANLSRGGNLRALLAVAKTPGLLALPPALFVSALHIAVPPVITRPTGLLAQAMVPTMIVALGVQLASVGIPRITFDMVASNITRLIISPILAVLLVVPFGLVGVERGAGIVQASMPAAVLASIIALENDLLPAFVIGSVLFSTLASAITILGVLVFLGH